MTGSSHPPFLLFLIIPYYFERKTYISGLQLLAQEKGVGGAGLTDALGEIQDTRLMASRSYCMGLAGHLKSRKMNWQDWKGSSLSTNLGLGIIPRPGPLMYLMYLDNMVERSCTLHCLAKLHETGLNFPSVKVPKHLGNWAQVLPILTPVPKVAPVDTDLKSFPVQPTSGPLQVVPVRSNGLCSAPSHALSVAPRLPSALAPTSISSVVGDPSTPFPLSSLSPPSRSFHLWFLNIIFLESVTQRLLTLF